MITIEFPARWIDASRLEEAIKRAGNPHGGQDADVTLVFPDGCSVMVDAAVRLLSFVNQLDHCTRRVRLRFDAGYEGTMGYLDRLGFFDHLSQSIETTPDRPTISAARVFSGENSGLVEIAAISRNTRDETLPRRLTNALMTACSQRSDASELQGATLTIFKELIDNIFSHSETSLPGFAALQLYRGGGNLKIAVSDSGKGMLTTLRPALETESPPLAGLSDTDLLVEVFRQGLSRHGKDRGCGLKGCADKAIKFKAELDVRLLTSRVQLVPSRSGYTPNAAYCSNNLPLVWGTHVCFTFALDK